MRSVANILLGLACIYTLALAEEDKCEMAISAPVGDADGFRWWASYRLSISSDYTSIDCKVRGYANKYPGENYCNNGDNAIAIGCEASPPITIASWWEPTAYDKYEEKITQYRRWQCKTHLDGLPYKFNTPMDHPAPRTCCHTPTLWDIDNKGHLTFHAERVMTQKEIDDTKAGGTTQLHNSRQKYNDHACGPKCKSKDKPSGKEKVDDTHWELRRSE